MSSVKGTHCATLLAHDARARRSQAAGGRPGEAAPHVDDPGPLRVHGAGRHAAIVASWFVWTGEELVLPTFISAPHVSHAAYRVRALRTIPDVAVSIDTESSPPEVLSIRGKAEITEIDGVAAEYVDAAHRFLGSHRRRATSPRSTIRVRVWRASPSGRPGLPLWTSRPGCRAPSAASGADPRHGRVGSIGAGHGVRDRRPGRAGHAQGVIPFAPVAGSSNHTSVPRSCRTPQSVASDATS